MGLKLHIKMTVKVYKHMTKDQGIYSVGLKLHISMTVKMYKHMTKDQGIQLCGAEITYFYDSKNA